MRYLAYCPITLEHDVALAYATQFFEQGKVVIVCKKYDGTLYHRSATFTKAKADAYGHDLYLYSVDDANRALYLDCGGFN